ncbi:MAG: hypothetical protein ACFCU8_04185 [Thermosynechococcaceae cyanobacterium]
MFPTQRVLTAIGQVSVVSMMMLPAVNIGHESASAASKHSTAAAVNAFYDQDHGYCDAQMLSAYWGKSTHQVKLKAGRMMRENAQFREVRIALQRARNAHSDQVDCRYTDGGFDYDDAVAVANYWQTSVGEAKVGLEQKLKGGYFQTAKELVQTAHRVSSRG